MCKSAADQAAANRYLARKRATMYAARQAAQLAGAEYIEPTLARVYAQDSGVCYLCGNKTSAIGTGHRDNNRPTVDHVVPISCGGTHTLSNARLACFRCNRLKSVDTIVEMVHKLEAM